MDKTQHPLSLRLNDEDKAMFEYLKDRLGLVPAQLIRLAIRRLYQSEKKLEGK